MRPAFEKQLLDQEFKDDDLLGELKVEDFMLFREIVNHHTFIIFTPIREHISSCRIEYYKKE
jgi:hypothetical protein